MSAHSRHTCPRWLKLTATLLSGLCVLIVAAVIFLTLWLTPSRLSEIVSSRASQYLDADVRVENLRFTLWSSFPRLCIEADSCSVLSRSLDSIPASLKSSLPANYRNLYSSGPFRGGINLPALLMGRIRLRDLKVDRACVNLLAVNDSLSNWNIFPSDPHSSSRIPHIYVNLVSLRNIKHISFRSLSSGLDLCLKPQTATIKALKRSDSYACKFDGLIDADIPGFTLLSDFPFDLMGDVALNFNPFKVKFSDFSIGLGNIHAHLSLDFLAENDPKFNSLSFNIDSFKLLSLFGYLPASVIPDLRGLDRSVEVNASARLTRPYTLSSDNLPSLALFISIPEGNVDIPLSSSHLPVWHSTVSARLDFNGDNIAASRLTLSPFDIKGDGIKASFQGSVSNITEQPHISSVIDVNGDLKRVGALIPAFGKLKPAGNVSVSADVSFSIPDYSRFAMQNLDIKAKVSSPGFTMDTEPGRSSLKANRLNLVVASDGELDDGSFHTSAPVAFNLSTDSASWRRGNTTLSAKKLSVKGKAKVLEPDSIFRSLLANLSSSDFKVSAPGHTLDFGGVDVDASLRMASLREKKSLRTDARPLFADSVWLTRTPHLPDVLTVNSPGFAKFVRNWRLTADLRLNSARWDIAGYPYPFSLGKTSLWCDFDSISLRRFNLSSGVSDMALTGSASGFRALLAGSPWAPVNADLTLKGNTIDINQIVKATDSPDNKHIAANGGTAHPDSIPPTPAWILPRNINALLSLSANHLYYTNLDLEDLDACFVVTKGILHIPYTRLSTGFGHMNLNADFDSSNIADLSMSATLDLQDIDLAPMFAKFKSLSKKFPQIRNLSGKTALTASVDFNIFPDMSVDMSSLMAQMGVSGRDLMLRQDPFIRKVTRMMLIRHDNPISITDIDICATVHDNLLELYPFRLDFENYRLSMQGLNNFAGDIDYHIGIMHSPIPFPFGINVEGTYHHPAVHFGGARWKADGARRITSNIEKSFTWNFVHKMQWAGKMFMKKAASGQTF